MHSQFLDSLGATDPQTFIQRQQAARKQQQQQSSSTSVNTTEKFYLTAADPSDGKLEDRLTEVINAKYEAGFLKPYNYVNGYARLQKYMDNKYDTYIFGCYVYNGLAYGLYYV